MSDANATSACVADVGTHFLRLVERCAAPKHGLIILDILENIDSIAETDMRVNMFAAEPDEQFLLSFPAEHKRVALHVDREPGTPAEEFSATSPAGWKRSHMLPLWPPSLAYERSVFLHAQMA